MAVLLILLCVFVLTWFASLPPPFFIILVIFEAIALVLFLQPYAMPLLR
jgi:hypothetical protein